MKDLFLPQEGLTEQTKQAEMSAQFLSADASSWIKEVINIFLQDFPFLQEEAITITWTKKDPDKGYAVGSLNVINARVPVIINDFNLSPLDVIITSEGLTLPLNEYFLQMLYQEPKAFESLQNSETKEQSLFGSHNALQFSPVSEYGQGNTGRLTRDAVKTASVIDALEFVHEQDATEILEGLKDANIKRAFVENKNIDVLKKIAQKAIKSTSDSNVYSLTNSLPIDRQMVYTDEYGNYRVKQANSTVGKVWDREISFADAQELDELKANTKTAKQYFTKVASEQIVFGINIASDNDLMLYIDSEGNYETTRTKLASVTDTYEGTPTQPKVGDTGVFVIDKVASTDVFEVLEIRKDNKGWNNITGTTGFFDKVAFKPTIATADTFFEEDGTTVIPKNASFYKLANREPKLAELDRVVKDRWERAQRNNKELQHKIACDSAGLYSLEGREFDKYAETQPTRNLTVEEAQWAALHCGATASDVEKIASLRPGRAHELEGLITAPIPSSDFTEKVAERYESLSEKALDSKVNLVKVAAQLKDKTTVDAVLSLGLARRRNQKQYLDMLPMLEAAMSELAKLVIAARLGLESVSPDAVKDAMDSMAMLVQELHALKSTKKKV